MHIRHAPCPAAVLLVLLSSGLRGGAAEAQFVFVDQETVLPTAHGIARRGAVWYVAASFVDPGSVRTYNLDFELIQTVELAESSDSRGLTFATSSDTFFVSDVDQDMIFEYRIEAGAALLQQQWPTSPGLPNGVAHDAGDDTLWLAYGGGDVEHRSRFGALLDSFSLAGSWTGTVVDHSMDRLLLYESDDTVWEVAKDGTGLTRVVALDWTPSNGQGIHIDPITGFLYLTDIGGSVVVLQDPGRAGCTRGGVDVLLSQGLPFIGGIETYYGGQEWPQMSALLDAKSQNLTVASSLDDLGLMLGFDSLWIDQRGSDFDPGSFLSAEELTNVRTFIETGKRVVMIGENSNWSSWNTQILGLVGGTYSGATYSGLTSAASNHPLVSGVAEVDVLVGGVAEGGTPLFDDNFATLFESNVLTILEVGSQASTAWGEADNAAFFSNVADWIACSDPPIFVDGFESGDTTAWTESAP